MKKCSRCGEEKPLDDFSPHKKAKDGKQAWCKPCRNEYRRENLDRYAEAQQRWRERNPEAIKSHRRAQVIRYKGLTEQGFAEMVLTQAGRCSICKEEFEVTPAIDHDHNCCPGAKACGACVRSLLCHRCNQGLGHFQDDPDRIEAAAEYLRYWNSAAIAA